MSRARPVMRDNSVNAPTTEVAFNRRTCDVRGGAESWVEVMRVAF